MGFVFLRMLSALRLFFALLQRTTRATTKFMNICILQLRDVRPSRPRHIFRALDGPRGESLGFGAEGRSDASCVWASAASEFSLLMCFNMVQTNFTDTRRA